MALAVNVVLHQHIIFEFAHLLRQIQVSRLKSRLKQQCVVSSALLSPLKAQVVRINVLVVEESFACADERRRAIMSF